VFIGAVYEDSSGYPDCRPEFYEAFNRVVALGTRAGDIRVETPVIGMSKAQIVREGLRLGAPLHLTWSCYRAEERACGTCDSCALRLRGFQEAGVEDPIPYEVRPSYRRLAAAVQPAPPQKGAKRRAVASSRGP
jgi:7-cyano-7-deazaguanine synthase